MIKISITVFRVDTGSNSAGQAHRVSKIVGHLLEFATLLPLKLAAHLLDQKDHALLKQVLQDEIPRIRLLTAPLEECEHISELASFKPTLHEEEGHVLIQPRNFRQQLLAFLIFFLR
jgi:hypothetical protein